LSENAKEILRLGFKKAFMFKQPAEYFVAKPFWLITNKIIFIIGSNEYYFT
jgi:hypothetical protein